MKKAIIQFDAEKTTIDTLKQTIEKAGYQTSIAVGRLPTKQFFGIAVALVISILVLVEVILPSVPIIDEIPFGIGVLLVFLSGYNIFKHVFQQLRQGRVISHTLMTAAIITAILVREWHTAILVVLIMPNCRTY